MRKKWLKAGKLQCKASRPFRCQTPLSRPPRASAALTRFFSLHPPARTGPSSGQSLLAPCCLRGLCASRSASRVPGPSREAAAGGAGPSPACAAPRPRRRPGSAALVARPVRRAVAAPAHAARPGRAVGLGLVQGLAQVAQPPQQAQGLYRARTRPGWLRRARAGAAGPPRDSEHRRSHRRSRRRCKAASSSASDGGCASGQRGLQGGPGPGGGGRGRSPASFPRKGRHWGGGGGSGGGGTG